MLSRLLLAVLFVFWGLGFFLLGQHLTFPSDLARDRLIYELDHATDGGMALRLSEVSPWWGTGVSLHDAQLFQLPQSRRRRTEEAAPTLLVQAEKFSARLRLLPLLWATPTVAMDADMYGGDVDGTVALDGKVVKLDLLGSDLDLGRFPFEGETWSADVGGLLRTRALLDLDQEDLANSTGRLRFEFTDLVINEASVMGLTLGQATFTEAVLAFRLRDGKAEVKKGSFVSDMLEVTVDGYVGLQQTFARSRLNLDLEVKLGDDLDTLAKMAPGVKDARDDDGVYHFTCVGTMERPSCRPQRSTARRAPTRPSITPSPSAIRSTGDDDLGNPVDDEEAEARREMREKRLAERRERIRQRREEREQEQQTARRPSDELDRPIDDEEFIDEDPEFDPGFDPVDDGPMNDPDEFGDDPGDELPPDLPYLGDDE